jgi:hypothetical protein
MNGTNNTNNHDQQIRALLRKHVAVDARATPGFGAAVWRRIGTGRGLAASWPAWLRAHAFALTACTAACIMVAVVSAGFLANSEARREREALIERYITSIDPLQKTASVGVFPENHR